MRITQMRQPVPGIIRFIFKQSHSSGVQPLTEWQEEGTSARAMELMAPEVESSGLQLSGDQIIDAKRLGVRKDLHNVIPNILFRRFKESMIKGKLPETIKQEKDEGARHHYNVAGGFFRRVGSWIKRKFQGEAKARFEEVYGGANDLDSAFLTAGHRVMDGLTPDQQIAVSDYLTLNGVALPPMPARVPPGVPSGHVYVRRCAQLGSAPASLLTRMCGELRVGIVNVFDLPQVDPLLPARPVRPTQPIEELIAGKNSLAVQRYKQHSTTINDPQRLGVFVHDLEHTHPEIHKLVTKEILMDNALYGLENNEPALKLVLYLEQRLRLNPDEDLLIKELEYIRDNAPKLKSAKKEVKKDGEKTEEQEKEEIKKLEEQTDKLADAYNHLSDNYDVAGSLGRALFGDKLNLLSAIAGGSTKSIESLSKISEAKESEKRKMFKEIRGQEDAFSKEVAALHKMLKDKDKTALTPCTNLLAFIDSFVDKPPKKSTELEMFGDTDPTAAGSTYSIPASAADAYMTKIRALTPTNFKGIKDEIEKNFHGKFKKSTKFTPFELMQALFEGVAVRRGIMNPEMRKSDATAAAAMWCGLASNVQLNRSVNSKHAEWLAAGRFSRAKKWLQAKLNMGGIYDAEDYMDYIAGFDKDFAIFKGLKKNATPEELIRRIAENNLSDEKLLEIEGKMVEAITNFKKLHNKGKVEMYWDDAFSAEELCGRLEAVRAARWARGLDAEVRKVEGNKAEILLEKMREFQKKRTEDHKTILSKVKGELPDLFDKENLKAKFMDKLRDALKEKKKNKMSTSDFLEGLDQQGMGSAYKALKAELMQEQAKEMMEAGAKRSGEIIKSVRSKVFSPAYNKVLAPAGRALASPFIWGAKNLIKRPVVGGAKLVKNVAVGTAKVIAAPAVLAGNIVGGLWKWVNEPWVKPGHAVHAPPAKAKKDHDDEHDKEDKHAAKH